MSPVLVFPPVVGAAVANRVTEWVGLGMLAPTCTNCGELMVDATGDWQCHGCQVLWPADSPELVPVSGRYIVATTSARPSSDERSAAGDAWVASGNPLAGVWVGAVLGRADVEIFPVVSRLKLGVDSGYDPGGGPWVGASIGGMFEDRLEFVARHNGLMGYSDLSDALPWGDWSSKFAARITWVGATVDGPSRPADVLLGSNFQPRPLECPFDYAAPSRPTILPTGAFEWNA